MNRPWIIGVMGGGDASDRDCGTAYELGRQIARKGWILLNGGRNRGIMDASAKGAWEAGGITLGILPDDTAHQASSFIRIPVLTGMGSARNCINILTSHVVIACPGGAGTLSEIALALKHGRPVILLQFDSCRWFDTVARPGPLFEADTPGEAVARIRDLIEKWNSSGWPRPGQDPPGS